MDVGVVGEDILIEILDCLCVLYPLLVCLEVGLHAVYVFVLHIVIPAVELTFLDSLLELVDSRVDLVVSIQ